jgi:hypothetical protein
MSTQELYEFHLQRAKELADKIADEGADTTLSSLWRFHIIKALENSNKSGKPSIVLV